MPRDSSKSPTVYIIAGPNGAGKTTFAMDYLPRIAACRHFINADLIARGLSPLDVDAAAMTARRLFLQQIKEHVARRQSFAFETTLSGLRYVQLLQRLRNRGYQIRLYFLWLPTIRLACKRIGERVKRGGHSVPQEVVRRRYHRGIRNLFRHYLALTDYCVILDNSRTEPALIYERAGGQDHVMNSEAYALIIRQGAVKP